ncbi:MAG TPA: PepSY domain-containing protein [Bradyrhizobium sp.]|nr:PepSY domain-containing protein [Bradyrhizobium sp.]
MHRSTFMHCTAAIFLSASALAGTTTLSTKHAVAVPYAANSLAAAVAAAEKRLKGQAIGVDHEQQADGRLVYEIEVRNGSNVFDVEVDADKGTVIATAEGRPGADDDKSD